MEFDSNENAQVLTKYLGSRFHPELPHIGTLGTADVGYFEKDFSDEESEEEKQNSEGTKQESDKPKTESSGFKFVPFSASYRLNLEGQKDIINTHFSFYLRIDEGSWHDLQGENNPGFQEGDPDTNRDGNLWLNKDILSKSFKKFDVIIESNIERKKQNVRVSIDGNEVDNVGNFLITTESVLDDGYEIVSKLQYHSNPIVTGFGKMKDLIQQKYEIEFKKSIHHGEGNKIRIDVEITNKSPFTQTSRIPEIEFKENTTYETEEECIERHKEEIFINANQNKELYSKWNPKIFNKKNSIWTARGALYGHLLEFSIVEEGIDSLHEPYSNETEVEHVINLIFDERLERDDDGKFKGSIIYKNHIIFDEQIPPMVFGENVMKAYDEIGMSENFAEIVSKKYKSLYKFQYDSINAINLSIKSKSDSGVLISTRTGGGKTEAFLFPVIDYCLNSKEEGTKAIVFYPTKALANDQTSRMVEWLYNVNEFLKTTDNPKKITVGICHGSVPKSDKSSEWQTYWQGIPLKCPKCKTGTVSALEHTKVQCQNQKCQLELDFVILFQEPNFGILPDILVTTPDKLQFDMMERPDHHGIFGREIVCCKNCNSGFAQVRKRKCALCSQGEFTYKKPLPPKFIIFDEIHQFKGTFGTNTLYLYERLKTLFKKYAKRHYELDWNVCSIGSSATISNAKPFSKIFFGLEKEKITIVPKDEKTGESYYEDAKKFNRTHLIVMPYRYRPGSTCSKAVGFLEARQIEGIKPEPFSDINKNTGEPLQILGFVNSMQDIGLLTNMTGRERKYSLPVFVGGHSTDYDSVQRADAERKFNKGELNVIFATPTLEVGVDFETVNAVMIYGFPYSFNDYVQRIGRGGRGENTLVMTICHNYKPIDHFFYVDAKKKISDQHASIEPIPVSRDNPAIIKKHLVSAVLDHISSLSNSPEIWDNVRDNLKQEFESNGEQMYDLVKEFSPINSLGLSEMEKQEHKEFVRKVISQEKNRLGGLIQNATKRDYIRSNTRDSLENRYKISKLRSTESEVKVEMIWEVLER